MKNINKKDMSDSRQGFTLVELLLVIAIIGILAAVLFVSLGKQRERARITTFKENVRGLVTAATACRDGGGDIFASTDGTVNADGTSNVCVGGTGVNLGIGKIPEISDCDGADTVNLTVSGPTSDTWAFWSTCTTSTSASDCVANCAVDGCVFHNCE